MFHWEGEAAAARAAKHHGTLYGLSSLATTGITEIGKLHDGPKVFQLYVWKDRELVKEVLAKAKEGGFHALALTVDFTWYGNRERGKFGVCLSNFTSRGFCIKPYSFSSDIRNDFSIPPKYSLNQIIEAIKKPAWTYDFLSHEPYTYACINKGRLVVSCMLLAGPAAIHNILLCSTGTLFMTTYFSHYSTQMCLRIPWHRSSIVKLPLSLTGRTLSGYWESGMDHPP